MAVVRVSHRSLSSIKRFYGLERSNMFFAQICVNIENATTLLFAKEKPGCAGLIFVCSHDCKNAGCDCWICWVF
jgi:hypothetical protein